MIFSFDIISNENGSESIFDSLKKDTTKNDENVSSELSDCSVLLYKSDGTIKVLDYDWSVAPIIVDGEESYLPYIYFNCDEGIRYRIQYCFNAWEGYSNKPIYYEYLDDLSDGSWDLAYNGEEIYKGSFSQVLAGPNGLIKICPGFDGSVISSSTASLHMEKYVIPKGFIIEIYE